MRWDIQTEVADNSFEYFERTLITDNGYREYDVRWRIPEEINPNGFIVLGRAYGTMMRDNLQENTVVVGHDFRKYSQELSSSLIVGLLSTGVRVIDVGLALSPMVYFAQYHFKCKAALMVTASHNENGWTGVKIANGFSSTLEPDGISLFRNTVEAGNFASGAGTYESFDGLFDAYLKDLVRDYQVKDPVRVVVAAGNGTAGRYAPDVFRALGCEVIELDCTPDWDFKKHNPNPEDISFLAGISQATKENKAKIGIGIDGDGDRIGVVDEFGEEIFSDKLGLLVARWICKDHPNRNIVIDAKSTGLFYDDELLVGANMRIVTWKSGHSYIKAKVAEKNAIAGFEKSGHWFFNEPYGRGYDDAIASSVQLLKMLEQSDKSLSQMVDELPCTWQSPTLSPYCDDGKKYDLVDKVTAQYQDDLKAGLRVAGKAIKDIVTVNGVRFTLEDNSWGLVRASSNKPCLALVAESRDSEDDLYEIMDHIQARLAEFPEVGDYDQQMPPRNSGQ